MANFFTKLFGSKNARELRRMQKIVDRINALEESLGSAADLPQLTQTWRERASAGESLDALLPEAFAAVREAAKRAKGMRHYDAVSYTHLRAHET